MTLSDDPHATRLDLIEWSKPRDEAKPYAQLNHLGIARIALFTKGLREEYQRLKNEGVSFISEPVTIRTGAGKRCSHASTIPTAPSWNSSNPARINGQRRGRIQS